MICLFSFPLTLPLTKLLVPFFVFPGYFVCLSVIAVTTWCCHYFFRYLLFDQRDCGSLRVQAMFYLFSTSTMPDI